MNSLFRSLKKNYDATFIGLLGLTISIIQFFPACKIYPKFDFDSQAVLTWDYNATIGQLPYRDIFFPYGILTYYKDHFFFANFIFFILIPILVLGMYWCFKSFSKNVLLSLFYVLTFIFFIYRYIGWENFARYGAFIISSLYFAYFLSKSKKNYFLPGLISGIAFSLFPDTGIYSIFVFVVLFFSFRGIKKTLRSFAFYFLGVVIGILPIFVYLQHFNLTRDFILTLGNLSQVALYAKTPFLHSLKSAENIFTLFVIFTSVFFLSYKFFVTQTKMSLITAYEIVLILSLIILEQKSIIRSLDTTVTFVSILILFVLAYDLNNFFKKNLKSKKPVILLTAFITLFVLFFFRPLNQFATRTFGYSQNQCIEKNLTLISKKQPDYQNVVNFLKTNKDFNQKVFSFPDDSVFYLILGQKTPYFSNTYDASAFSSQQIQINFLKRENIRYVLFNETKKATQDGVPDKIRARFLYNYIFSHYKPFTKIGQFTLLKKL